MKKEKLLKISMLSIIVIIIIVLVLLIIIFNEGIENNNLIDSKNELQTESKEGITESDYNTTFFTIEALINNYLTYCQIDKEENNDDIYMDEVMTKDDKLQIIYNMLDKSYIDEKNITIETIQNKIKLYKEPINFQIEEIKLLNTGKIVSYAVYGKVEKQENSEKIQDVYFITNMNKESRIFSIRPISEKNITNIDDIKIVNNVNQIEKNNDNTYFDVHLTELQKAKKYFQDFKDKMLYQPQDAYELLKEEYREIKYENVEEFKNYILLNTKYLKSIQIVEYTLDEKEDYTIYKCEDQYGKKYILEESAPMKYTVQLDEYTLTNEQFNEKYEEASGKNKGIYNINKFFEMINTQDYKSAYKVLDENFRQNYFKTQADFENYIKNKIFKYNKVEYKEYSNRITDIYTYKVLLTDMTGENQNQIEFNIVMKLLEGTDFVMSFQVS